MPDSNVVVPPDLRQLINDREKVWADFDRSQNLSAELGKLSSHVPKCAPAELQLKFGAGSTPSAELGTVVPLLKEKIEAARKLNTDVKACYDQIEAIKHKEKIMTVVAAVAGVLVLFVLVLMLVKLVS